MTTIFRRLTRRPMQTILVILTVGLGAGAATTMISAVYGVLLAPLPYPDAERLVSVQEMDEDETEFGTTGYTTFDEWRRSLRSFASLSANASRSYTLTSGTEPRQLNVLGITHETFETLGVRPILGREFVPSDDVRGAPRTLVLSHELWREQFGSDEKIIGKVVRMSDIDFEVIGVMPPRVRLREEEWRGKRVDAWVALRYAVDLPYACRSCRHIFVAGRLKPGVSIDTAAREVETFTASLRKQYPDAYPSRGFTRVVPMHDLVAGRKVRTSLWIVFAVTIVVLIAAIANAGGIRLSEMYARRNEVQVRQALGATTAQLAKLLVAESIAHALLASLLGLGIAYAGVAWLRTRATEFVPRTADLQVNAITIGACIALALLSGLIIGIIPALRARRWSPVAGRGVIAPRSRAQRVLVGVSVAISVVLLGSGALLLRSMRNLFAAPTGLAKSLVVFRVSISGNQYDTNEKLFALHDRFLREAEALPEVNSVALTSQFPFAEDQDNASMLAQDRAGREAASDAPDAQRFFVSPAYFSTAGIPLLRGRAFLDSDRAATEPVVILNQTAAEMLWPTGDAIGKRVRIGGGDAAPFRLIVGIAADVAPGELGAAPKAQAYLPLAQSDGYGDLTGIARSSAGAAGIREVMRKLDPNVAFYRVTTLKQLVAASEARRAFILTCLVAFSIVTLILAVMGVYGIISLLVSSRTRELGVRMALGSTARGIFRLVVGEGLRIVAVAVVAGIAATLLFGRALRSILYQVSVSDPIALSSITAIVVIASIIACSVPAWRASRLSPLDALRDD